MVKIYQTTGLTHKIIIPRSLIRDHEEAEETVGQQHLYLFVMTW